MPGRGSDHGPLRAPGLTVVCPTVAAYDPAMVPTCHIDHITVISPSLAAGAAWVHRCLGVDPQPGGTHPRMGTHNLLLPLGATMFVEVIAIDPAAARPARPRWFELDRLSPDDVPRLGCWVARSDDLRESLAAASEDLGMEEPMSRGVLDWHISLPADGSLPLGGTGPALIRWQTDVHPAQRLRDVGCRLVELRLLHPDPERLTALVTSLRLAEWCTTLSVGDAPAPGLVASIDTPHGLRTLGGTAAFIRA